jgi:hypothetical protein
MFVKRDNVAATLFHMHVAVRCHSPELLVKPHDNHATTLLLTEKNSNWNLLPVHYIIFKLPHMEDGNQRSMRYEHTHKMYLLFAALTSRPTSLLVTNKASVFFLGVQGC